MKKTIIIALAIVLFAVPAFAKGDGPSGPSSSPPGQTETYTQTQNVFGSGAASLSGSGVAGWGNSSAIATNSGSAFACGNFATSKNTSLMFSRGNAGGAALGLSAAGTFNYTNKITITQPKTNGPK
jgi:hypothetical protein